jgi:hypothetical protein
MAVLVTGTSLSARADDDPDYLAGPWHFKAVTCVDTTVLSVTPRLDIPGPALAAMAQSGVEVTFNTTLGLAPLFSADKAEVVHYQGDTANHVMESESAGTKVQVCFLGGPAPTQYCNPDKDDRGRRYRVYDYRQRQQYWGMNSEHDCGGA